MKICPMTAELFLEVGRTDRYTGRQKRRQTDKHDEANCRFKQFCNSS